MNKRMASQKTCKPVIQTGTRTGEDILHYLDLLIGIYREQLEIDVRNPLSKRQDYHQGKLDVLTSVRQYASRE